MPWHVAYCPYRKRVLFILLIVSFSFSAVAQLKAEFTIDNSTGCSPLTVNFTNKTINASPNAIYLWNFGNGNTSDKKDAAAVYYETKVFYVTLTVIDNGTTSVKNASITVYKKPTVNFSVTTSKGCAPFDVSFVSTSLPGDGTIANYFWDFGDGNTKQGATLSAAAHTYTFPNKPPVKLTVKNSFGCDATLEKFNLVEIVPSVKPSFTAGQTFLCKVPETVSFINNSTGPGQLFYSWDFGDNKTSTDKDPVVVSYSTKGTYSVKLKVSSSDGCADSLIKTAYINAANFTSKFELPDPSCSQQYLNFSNQSQPSPTQTLWLFGDDNSSLISNNTSHYYTKPGTFSVKMINTYGLCKDTVSKNITIGSTPTLNGFVLDKTGTCKAPLTVNFADTTTGAVKWKWNFGTGNSADTSSLQKPSFTFTRLGTYYVALIVTTAQGCQASFTTAVTITRPNVYISYTKSSSPSGLYGCPGLTIKFKSFPENEAIEHRWSFGDGSTSTVAEPEYTYNEAGNYTVKLYYKTAGGCEDSVVQVNYVRTYTKPKADFTSLTGLSICGQSPVEFKDLTDSATSWKWDFGDGGTDNVKNPFYSYGTDGKFTVTLIATNNYCSDTVRKEEYIKVIPPFPDITSYSKNCIDRGTITLNQTSKGALSWSWNYGDGSSEEAYNVNKPQVSHTYTKSGVYKVHLTATNGQCTTYDTMFVSVLVKQYPKLTADKSSICGNDTLVVKINSQDTIKYYYPPTKTSYTYPYSGKLVYSDGTIHSYFFDNWYPPQHYIKVTKFRPGIDSLRLIIFDGINNCYDTSNYIHLKVSGPVVGFKAANDIYCSGAKVMFTDTSKAMGSAHLVKWMWDFGDGLKDTLTTNGSTSHIYSGAKHFYPRLKVIDANGCFAESASNVSTVEVYGPSVDFTAIPTNINPNDAVQFTNKTALWPFFPITYTWDFGDGTPTSSEFSPNHTYTKSGTYTVKLIAKSSYGCSDTLIKEAYIIVKTVKAVFQLNSSYLNANNCPPLVARFENKSTNADSIFWGFGDNSYADNIANPSHTYYQSGTYTITLYAYGKGGAIDSTKQEIVVRGPFATIAASTNIGCSPTPVTLTAVSNNVTQLTWDFGDGFVTTSSDTFAEHTYNKAGIYQPKVILKDAGGCSSTFQMQDSIIIDILKASYQPDNWLVCHAGWITFKSLVSDFGKDSLKTPLKYHWNFGTGRATDTSSIETPKFYFDKSGRYPVTFTTSSFYGCKETITDTIEVLKKPEGQIDAIDELCAYGTILFKGAVLDTAQIKWNWDFGNNQLASVQNPPSQTFVKAGNYKVKLIVYNTPSCSDTVYKELVVHPNPIIKLNPKDTLICKGDTVHLQAHDGIQYQWSSSSTSGLPNSASLRVVPTETTKYKVIVTNEKHCKATDSVTITVSQPFNITIIPAMDSICLNSSVQLQADGAVRYVWTPAVGLNNSGIQNPLAKPTTTTQYRVIGYGSDECFTDTGYVKLNVVSLPKVQVNQDTSILVGTNVSLKANVSNDVTKINWNPSSYLDCIDCSITVSAPRDNITYLVKVNNSFGCQAIDTVNIKLVCSDGGLFIPNSFTPNNDGVNDIFYPRGKGVKTVKYLRIFNRWGELVFEKRDFNIDDKSIGWDGSFKAQQLPSDVFVYNTEMVCDAGGTFTLKGTIMIIR